MSRLGTGERHLLAVDPVMAALIEAHGPCGLPRRRRRRDPFAALVRSIVGQMLSGKAAATIHARLLEEADGEATPERLTALSEERLRGAGLSRAKAGAIAELARRVTCGELDLERLCRRDDEAIAAELRAVRGIGPWTVQMFLMFQLGRKDVFPCGDLGVREGLRRAYALPERPTQAQARAHAEPWAPYRSVAAWYLWRVLDAP